MQSEAVLTLLTALITAVIGAVGLVRAARVTGGGEASQDDWADLLLSLSSYCGGVRGVAEAAVKDCEQALLSLREGAGGGVRTAEGRQKLFADHTQRDDELAQLSTELRQHGYALDHFQRVLGRTGRKIDDFVQSPPEDEKARDRDLASLETSVRALADPLNSLDGSFTYGRDIYLERHAPMSARVRRRLLTRSREYYEAAARNAAPNVFEPPQNESAESSAEAEPAGSRRPAAGEAPPCGYCIWRCPHAPGGLGTAGEREAAEAASG
ncbi:hypothetical protein [Streptomyces poonensis]|uniref:Uncharacterized protein n=1 Tax=Streptomyces poonensis TaxID=68255 RepID=A0A918PA83_9ACTN|nr:hypothetical protein [Streptomyces poonensis]GGY93245.1 hypothetical protein GCM10010365_09870 [Streptomyces poonensis]GLJ87573.1 hypothetical protein GCM10017589_01730 [Streptomyces poonensis]